MVAVPGIVEAEGVRVERVVRLSSSAALSEILIEEDRLRSRVVELGEEISADYAGRDLLLIGVLKGLPSSSWPT